MLLCYLLYYSTGIGTVLFLYIYIYIIYICRMSASVMAIARQKHHIILIEEKPCKA